MAKTKQPSKPTRKEVKQKGKAPTPNYCSLVEVPSRQFAPDVGMHRAGMIIITQKKWVNGTKLKYYFFNGGSDGSPTSWKGNTAQKNAVKQSFDKWRGLGIGLEFEETKDKNEAEVRIGFKAGDGSWSYVGRDVIDFCRFPR